MTEQALLIEVRWPDGRFHGVREATERTRGGAMTPEWPPSPFRLFQAMVAAAFGGRWAGEDAEAAARRHAAFAWLEALEPPVVSAPNRDRLADVTYYVPNNDLDAKGGDPAETANIRSAKVLRTSLFDPDRPVAYVWRFEGEPSKAQAVATYAERLHTLGHGIDAAFARGEVLDATEAEDRLERLGGAPRRPASSGGGAGVPCPAPGSLDSLIARHAATLQKFESVGAGRKSVLQFRQPPKAHARSVAYDHRPEPLLFDLCPLDGARPFRPWRQEAAAKLVEHVRDLLVERLGKADHNVQRYVVGRGAGPTDVPRRLRIIPLPSIGMHHTDRSIRRVLVELPPECPLPLAEVRWALGGRALTSTDPDTGDVTDLALLVPSADRAMLRHYATHGERTSARRWRTVTPAVLPEVAARRRIDPVRLAEGVAGEAKSAPERQAEEARAASSVLQALRHAGVTAPVTYVRVQREPFDVKGARAEAFAPGARFAKERLWHVDVAFADNLAGPLLIGDGRFCGLGLMAPSEREQHADAFRFSISGELEVQDGPALLRAVRRALMSRAGEDGEALRLFSGHEADGAPVRSGRHEHAYLTLSGGDPSTLYVIAPWRVDRTVRPSTSGQRAFARVAGEVRSVRAGPLGVLTLTPQPIEDDGPFALAREWRLATPYRLNRHPRPGACVRNAAQLDMAEAVRRLGLPAPEIEITRAQGATATEARLRFPRRVRGPMLIGRDAHRGGGLLSPAN